VPAPLLSPTLTMNTGARIPQLGFGVWQIEDDGERVIAEALEVGYRHLDTAMIYHNEAEVGRAVAGSGIPRDELFVTTKLFNTDHGTQEALDAFERSLERLALEYVDLYLIHWPMPGVDRYVESWRALETIAASGRTRAIGVSNFMPEHLQRLLDETGTVPAVNQIEVHPEHQQTAASEFSREHGVIVEAYSPLANGRILDHPKLRAIADRVGKSVPQVLLRWQVELGNIAIPKTVSRERMIENLDIFDFELTPDDMAAVASFERGGRVGNDPRTVNGP
jgi:2,5-diketo-D-gluconate reductase A